MSKKTTMITVCLVGLAALLAVGYFLTIGIGKSISSNLSVVGQGKPVLVLAYANYSPEGGAALNHLRQVSTDFDSRIGFVVADLGTPEGKSFANNYQLVDGQAVFLNKEGWLPQITNIPADQQELRNRLETLLKAVD